MSTLVLLDTNAYLRLGRRVKPLLGIPFGQKLYLLTILPDVEEEVLRSPRLRFHFPWFESDGEAAQERLSACVQLSVAEEEQLDATSRFLYDWVVDDAVRFTSHGRSPPSRVDCRVLAFGQLWKAIVVTDDLAMHELSTEFDVEVWHGHQLLAKLRAAKLVGNPLVREIYDALDANGDLPPSWKAAKASTFARAFSGTATGPS